MTIDPLAAISLALHQHPGRYVLLLGSGVSRTAQISTGWEITLDLIQQWAEAEGEGEACRPDPAHWYHEKTGSDPDYSDLLEQVASTVDARQSLLRRYFEPGSDEDREAGRRVPTDAHRAIAKLIKNGDIKVIITLNFDRLLEDALVAEGVHPNIVSSEADAEGMIPLNHGEITVIKLHGDYRDTRLRNTPSELSVYPSPLQSLLDEILERYGLIVCGWSADWDLALRDAIKRTTRFRYQTFWFARGKLSGEATAVVKHRDATVIQIEGADEAFVSVGERLAALRDGMGVEPVSKEMALGLAKRYVSERKFDVQYHDLLWTEAKRVRESIGPSNFPWDGASDYAGVWLEMPRRVKQMESLFANLAITTAVGAYHGRLEIGDFWPRLLVQLGKDFKNSSGSSVEAFENLSKYPAVACLYVICICAVLRQNYSLIQKILMGTKFSVDGYQVKDYLCAHLSAPRAFQYDGTQSLHWKDPGAPEERRKKTPGSSYLVDALWEFLEPIIFDWDIYENAFDRVELIIGLCTATIGDGIAFGRFYWKSGIVDDLGRPDELGALSHELLNAGFFGGDVVKFKAGLEVLLRNGRGFGF